MNVIQENPPNLQHPKFNELMFPNNVKDEKHLERIREGYEKQRKHLINKLSVHMSGIYKHQDYDTKFFNPHFRGLYRNDPEHQYKIFSVPLPFANA